MKTKQLVSIVILNFNRKVELKDTIEKCKDIKYENLEIIIVDNGSSDGSREYIRSLPTNKYKTILLDDNRGTAYGRTRGQMIGKGEFIVHLDDDAFLNPFVIEKTVKIFNTNPSLGAIGYGLVNPFSVALDDKKYWENVEINIEKDRYKNSYHFPISPSGAAFRTSALIEVNYFDLNWDWTTRTEDNELTLKLIAHGYNTVIIDSLIAYHKAAPSHRVPEILTINSIHGILWIILKFYPLSYIITKTFNFIFLCIYFSLINRKLIYIKAILRSLKNSYKMLSNDKRINAELAKKINLRELNIFSMSSNVRWGGS